jgi:chromatin remodeling complex protein RSC6
MILSINMFSVTPKIIEPVLVLKKGRKHKELAAEYFVKASSLVDTTIEKVDEVIKLQDATPLEMRKRLRNAIRELKESRKFLLKFKKTQYVNKRTKAAGANNNTGFVKLRPISENMALFANWEYGKVQKSRHEVYNYLTEYIKKNELEVPEYRRNIRADAKLKKLFNLNDTQDMITYTSMNQLLNNCFEVEEKKVEEKKVEEKKVEEKVKSKPVKPQAKSKKTTPIFEE